MLVVNTGSFITSASLLNSLYCFICAPVMGGLTYGTYGAGTALTVIGLCMLGTQEPGTRGETEG